MVLLAAGGFFFQRRKKSKLARNDGPIEELQPGLPGPSVFTPFTDTPMPTGIKNAQIGDTHPSRIPHPEKLAIHQAVIPTDTNALDPVENSSRDGRGIT